MKLDVLPRLVRCRVGRGFVVSAAALPARRSLSAVSRAMASASPQRVARATTAGGPSPAEDEVGGGGERWRTRPADVDEMTKDRCQTTSEELKLF